MKNTEFVSKNPYLCKKDFYVTELHLSIDGLTDITDYKGPYNTLKSAQVAFKKFICADKFLNHWDYAIRGPEHTPKSHFTYTPTKTIWYADGTLKKYR